MAAQIEVSVSAEINEMIESLKENPIFHMSLGSRELFHSNFLAWLGERHLPILLNGLLHDRASPTKWDSATLEGLVQREKHNIDLLMEFMNAGQSCLLAVEVKVKDILRRPQLGGYDEAIEKFIAGSKKPAPIVYKVALTLTDPVGDLGDWKAVTFMDLSSRLSSSHPRLQGDSAVFLRKYQQFIYDMSRFSAKVSELSEGRATELAPFTTNVFPDDQINEKLERDLRLYSTFGKILATRLSHDLTKELIQSDDLGRLRVYYGSSNDCKDDEIFIAASGGFQSRNAFTSVSVNKWVPDSEGGKRELLSIGIMLQAGEYRPIISHSRFNFKKGRANDRIRREQMYDCVEKFQCRELLRYKEDKDLHGYSPQYIYTVEKIPLDLGSLRRKITSDLYEAYRIVKKEADRHSTALIAAGTFVEELS